MADGITADIATKLQQIAKIKADIAQAVNHHRQSGSDSLLISDSTPFSDYAEIIKNMNPSGKLGVLEASKNGTYSASDEKDIVGWSKVVVDVSGSSSGGSSGGGSSSSGSGIQFDEDGFTKLPTVHITYLNEDGSVWLEEDIEAGDDGSHLNDGPPKEAVDGVRYKFKRWEPQPIQVEADLTCSPSYRKNSVGLIEESYEDIVAYNGEYQYGDYFYIDTGWVSSIPGFDLVAKNGFHANPFTDKVKLHMVFEKVYNHEAGTTSTWLLKEAITINSSNHNGNVLCTPMGGETYDTSKLKTWLNNNLFNAMPDPIRNAIKPVVKYVPGNYVSNDAPNRDGGNSIGEQKLWIPGRTEILGTGEGGVNYYEDGPQYYLRNDGKMGGATYFLRSHDINRNESGYFRAISATNGEVSLKNTDYTYSRPGMNSSQEASAPVCPRVGFCL